MTLLTGAMTGTPAYMAPEQATGKTVDYRTDIYAFGLMLYEMFTGEQAFRADNAIALALKQLNESPKPPRQIEASIPASLESAILRCLEKEPSQRFQSIAELERVLRSPAGSPPERLASLSGVSSIPTTGPGSPAVLASHHSSPARPVSKRVWVLVALVLFGAFAALAARMAWRGLATRHAAEQVSPPPEKPAPAPPGASLETKRGGGTCAVPVRHRARDPGRATHGQENIRSTLLPRRVQRRRHLPIERNLLPLQPRRQEVSRRRQPRERA